MQNIVDRACAYPKRPGQCIVLQADRLTLAKRRWQGVAEDGAEFGFDLAKPLQDGAVIMESDSAHYVLRQKPESVLEVELEEAPVAAKVAWSIGNLHFPIEIDGSVIRVADDSAIRLFFERENITFTVTEKVFRPLKAIAHSHGNGHAH